MLIYFNFVLFPKVMNGGTFVPALMLKLLVKLTRKLLNLNLLREHTGEEMKRNQCSRGSMEQLGRVKNN